MLRGYKWYLKGMFPIPIMIVLFLLFTFFEIILPKYEIDGILSFFIFPLYIFFGVLHIIRPKDLTIMELSLIRDWLSIPISKFLALLTWILPFILLETGIMYYKHLTWLLLPLLILSINSIILGLLFSLLNNKEASMILLISFYFLIPIGISILVGTLESLNVKSNLLIQFLTYYLDTLAGEDYYKSHLFTLSLLDFLPYILVLDILFFFIYIITFIRGDYK
ncbi:hypothetical protein SJAV_18580 [Sulfurisphaera javensis]|uniref:ABC transporter permease n=1 Tax=Sulfurisphaera javensis TaxID=2049879 RepID=A0AAT9GSV7_9CREN